ncbi:MAG: thioredoxin family protein [Deltaproteobacteria bacterium]|nr:thioredoxin family protein [Deltaproteobacteria bacterium]
MSLRLGFACFLAAVLPSACGGGTSPAAAVETPPAAPASTTAHGGAVMPPTTAAPTPAAGAAVDPCELARREGGKLRWFHDDYAGAMACARSRSLPLAIDMWAPWCHTCLSMQAYVLTDDRLADYERRFVFLALDTDREHNAAVVAKFPPAAWPTFFVVSPVDESIQARFVGAATVEQFARFLDDGERGHMAQGGAALPTWDDAARRGDRASAGKQWADAAAAYAQAVAAAPADWPRGPDVRVSWLAALVRAHDVEGCATIASTQLDATGTSASATDFSLHVLGCADTQTDPTVQARLRDAVVSRLDALTRGHSDALTVDDLSDALLVLRQALDGLGRGELAKQAATRQRKLLDEATAKAESPRLAMTYNWPRAEVYAYLGVPSELVPALEQSVKDLPDEYDPPYRLAWTLLQAGEPARARGYAEQAIEKAYGPRKARAQGMLADIEHAAGDVEAERAARAAAVATLEALPIDARNPETIAKAKAELDAVGKPAAVAK